MKIELENVKKSFGQKEVLCDISLSLGESNTAVMGESGSGKTTLLRIIVGLEKADSGSVFVEGDIAFVFAEPRLFDNATVLENVTCVSSGKADAEKASEILSALGLEEALSLRPKELSTGMAQRVSLARAIYADRSVYLLDEPLRGLDEETKSAVIAFLRNFLKGKTAITVTHDKSDAEALCDRIMTLKDGKLVFEGTPAKLFEDPDFVRDCYLELPTLQYVIRLLRKRGVEIPDGIATDELLAEILCRSSSKI